MYRIETDFCYFQDWFYVHFPIYCNVALNLGTTYNFNQLWLKSNVSYAWIQIMIIVHFDEF